ncbi:MAG: hypothetical protein R2715_06135 [Ilumatobacteraceae bacterium]
MIATEHLCQARVQGRARFRVRTVAVHVNNTSPAGVLPPVSNPTTASARDCVRGRPLSGEIAASTTALTAIASSAGNVSVSVTDPSAFVVQPAPRMAFWSHTS